VALAMETEGAGPRAGRGARRLALWLLLVGLPLAYEASDRLPAPHAFFSGDAAYWFAGFHTDLVLMGGAAAVVAFALWQSRQGLESIGWPRRLPLWSAALLVATVLGALALAAFYHPPTVSAQVYGVTASAPVTRPERLALVAWALVDAVVQESVWRGAVLAWLSPAAGRALAVALSAVSFGFFHPVLGWAWGQLALRVPLALLYSGLVLWRKNIGPAAYLHFVLSAGQLLAPVAR
jgi:membrane protease YdiL (CAAX protease family)